MDEKILIKSEMNKKAKKNLSTIMGILFACTFVILVILLMKYESNDSYRDYMGYYHTYSYSRSGFYYAFDTGMGSGNLPEKFLTVFIFGCIFFLLSIFALLVFLAARKCELTITEKNVRGKTWWGKEVILPLYMVSAYSTRKLMSTITVSTSSGTTKFALIENYADIGKVLSDKINERQDNTAPSTPTPVQSNSMDDIAKLKTLLDQGIITQEEFEAKKKQLLGL